jgi:hypothetical protein
LHAGIVSPSTTWLPLAVHRAGDERVHRSVLPARYSIAKEHFTLASRVHLSLQIAQLIAEDSLGYWRTHPSSEIPAHKNL